MSDARMGGWADGKDRAPVRTAIPTITACAHPPIRQSALFAIRHSPDLPTHVVRDQDRAVGQREHRHRATPPRPVGELPPGDEVFDRDWFAVLYLHVDDLRAGGD